MKKIFLLLIVFLLIISISKAQCGTSEIHGVEIDGQCYDCGVNDNICPNIILYETYNMVDYEDYCESFNMPDPDCCQLISASISPNCGTNGCEQGETITMSATFSYCGAANNFQIDAKSTDNNCVIHYIEEDMSGINSDVTIPYRATTLTTTWTIPTIPNICKGKTITPTAVALWQGKPGTGIWLTGITNVDGSFAFYPQPECNDGIDNDNDGCIDYPNDGDCTSSTDTTESGTACGAPTCTENCDSDGTCNPNCGGICPNDPDCIPPECIQATCSPGCCLNNVCESQCTTNGNQACIKGNWQSYNPGECGTLVTSEAGCMLKQDHTKCNNNDPNYICINQATLENPNFVCQNLCQDPRVNECCFCYTTCLNEIGKVPNRAPIAATDCHPHELFELTECNKAV